MDVFLSYNHTDKRIAEKLANDLEQEGLSVWFDQERLTAGSNIANELFEAIRKSPNYFALVSSKSSESYWFSSELATALASKEVEPKRRIIPIVIEPEVEIPPFLRQYKAVDMSSPEKYHQHLPVLLETLKSEAVANRLPSTEEMTPKFVERILSIVERQTILKMDIEKMQYQHPFINMALAGALICVLAITAIVLWKIDGNTGFILSFFGGTLIGGLTPLFLNYVSKNHNRKSKTEGNF